MKYPAGMVPHSTTSCAHKDEFISMMAMNEILWFNENLKTTPQPYDIISDGHVFELNIIN